MSELKQINQLGMDLDQWTHKSCIATIGTGEDFATIFYIESTEKRKGHASELLQEMKNHYEQQGKSFGSSVSLNDGMRRLLKKFNITEYNEDYDSGEDAWHGTCEGI